MTEIHVTRVDARPGYRLNLVFNNGERRVFDMFPYLSAKPFHALKDPHIFAKAEVVTGTVVWPRTPGMAPATLYAGSRPS